MRLNGRSPPSTARLYDPAHADPRLDASGLTISLTDLRVAGALSTATWRLDVNAIFPEGKVSWLGRLFTVPPASHLYRAESRIIAEAYAPGAINWEVIAVLDPAVHTTKIDAAADLSLAGSPCCGPPGLHPIAPHAELSGELYYMLSAQIASGATQANVLAIPGARVLSFGAWQAGAGAFMTVTDSHFVGTFGSPYLPPGGSLVLHPDGRLRFPATIVFNFAAATDDGAWFIELER